MAYIKMHPWERFSLTDILLKFISPFSKESKWKREADANIHEGKTSQTCPEIIINAQMKAQIYSFRNKTKYDRLQLLEMEVILNNFKVFSNKMHCIKVSLGRYNKTLS